MARVSIPDIMGCEERARRVIHAENWIPESVENPEPTERWPQRAKHYRFGLIPSNDEATDQNIVTDGNWPARGKVLRLRTHRRELSVFQVKRDRIKRHSTTRRALVLVAKNHVTRVI